MKTCSLCGSTRKTYTETISIKHNNEGVTDFYFDLCTNCYKSIVDKIVNRTGKAFYTDMDIFTELRLIIVKNGIKGKT